ncbi:MAG: hypothetical protein CVV64_05555 [Candidatus Wallbacteria bacterium HGW-Wallbacteria-1]|jgi:diguanylate cyclase (GGDEF)-like protein|uniref:Diguanylate cyclase n=1 Tax=Candidatus Wallbacteria bacterium HGW-Wallbacteria-1 TaxID=2013854 RepID=A0A2N1PSC5_9BACT|nr:MAG: hypothetical protein CVV64_05555 [Candidatus Wallbacteria bacterium HGW-Wallbacteria-1]
MTQATVLIADDSPTILKLLRIHLTQRDYRVITVENGFDALKAVYEHEPDLIILDIIMPLMTGYQVCRILKNHRKYRDIPVIIFTTLEQRDKEYRALRTGANRYMQKPFEPEFLCDCVADLLKDREINSSSSEKDSSGGGVDLDRILLEVNEILDERLHEQTIFHEVSSLVRSADSHREIVADLFSLLRQLSDFSLGAVMQMMDSQPVLYFDGPADAVESDDLAELTRRALSLFAETREDIRGVTWQSVQKIQVNTDGSASGGRTGEIELRPLIAKGLTVGVIALVNHANRAVTSDWLRLFDLLADQSAVILEHARLFDDICHFSQSQTTRLETVYEIGRLMSSTMDVSDLLSIIVEVITKVMNCTKCSLFMIDRRTMNFFLRLGVGIPPEVLMSQDMQIDDNSVSGWVVKNREPLLIRDIDGDERFNSRERRDGYKSSSLMCVPILSRGTVLGVINVTDRRDRRIFTREDLELLSMLGHLVAVIIENTKLYNKMKVSIDKLNRKNWEMTTLFTLDEFLATLDEVDDLLKYIVINATGFCEASCGSIFFHDDVSETIVRKYSSELKDGLDGALVEKIESRLLSEGMTGVRAMLVGPNTQPISMVDLIGSSETISGSPRSAMVIPMMSDLGIMGCVVFLEGRAGNPFGADDLKFMSTLVSFVTKRVERLRALNLALKDPITGAYLPNYFHVRLQDEIRRARRYSRDLSVVTSLIDDFSIFTGVMDDRERAHFLSLLGAVMGELIRKVDLFANYGSGRFAFILPETNEDGARLFSMRLMKAIADMNFTCGDTGDVERLTASIGIVSYPGISVESAQEFLDMAFEGSNFSSQDGGNSISVNDRVR